MINTAKQKLQNGQQIVGCFLGFYSPTVVEILGYSGFDFVVFDNEHGAFSWAEVEQLVRIAEVAGIIPLVRVAYGPSDIQKALDRGAYGLHVPMINTKEQAEDVVRKAKFPPDGQRGTAYSTPSARFGMDKGTKYLNNANKEILICVHIETPQAVENIEEIMKVEGIDVCILGPADLSVTMGYADAGAGHPEVQAAIERVFQAGKKLGVPYGYPVADVQELDSQLRKGVEYVCIGITAMLFSKFKEIVDCKEKSIASPS